MDTHRQLEELRRRLDSDRRQAERRSDRIGSDLQDLKLAVKDESRAIQMLVFQFTIYVLVALLIGFGAIASRL